MARTLRGEAAERSEQLAEMADLVPPDRQPRWPVDVGQAGRTGPAEDLADRRGRQAEQRSEPVGSSAELRAGGQDPLDLLGAGEPGRAAWSPAPVHEVGDAICSVAAEPLVAGRPGSPPPPTPASPTSHRPSGRWTNSDRPKTSRRAFRMGHESLLTMRILRQPKACLGTLTVNNVFADDI